MDFASVKKRIDSLKAKAAKFEGQMEAIESRWDKEWGLKDRNAVEARIAELKKEKESLQEKQDTYLREIDALLTEAGA